MQFRLIGILIQSLLKALKDQEIEIKLILDDMIDVVEKHIAASTTKLDDRAIQPLIDAFRRIAGIPDDIGGDED